MHQKQRRAEPEQRRKIRETEELAQEVEELKAALGLSEAKASAKGA